MATSNANSGDRITLPWGYVEYLNNELVIVSTVNDPPKFKLFAVEGLSLGAWSFGRVRPDGVHEEMVLLQGKQDERTRENPHNYSGELTIHIRNGNIQGDAGFVKVCEMRHDGVWLKGLSAGSGLGEGGTPHTPPVQPPIVVPPPPGGEFRALYTNGKLDFDKITLLYGFESEDEQHYLSGKVDVGFVISEMDKRFGKHPGSDDD